MEFENLISIIQAVSASELTCFQYEEKGIKLKLTKEPRGAAGCGLASGQPPAGAASVVGSGQPPAGVALAEQSQLLAGAASAVGSGQPPAGAVIQSQSLVGEGAGSNGQASLLSQEGRLQVTETDAGAVQAGGQADAQSAGKLVLSPLVGTFYAAPAEDAEPYVAVGDTVKKGQILAIVEAMKLMNEIESEFDGVVEAVLVENGQPVEYNQPLFRLK